MAPELVAGGGYGGLLREKPYCALVWELAWGALYVPSPSPRSMAVG